LYLQIVTITASLIRTTQASLPRRTMVRFLQTLAVFISCSAASAFSPSIYRQAPPQSPTALSSKEKNTLQGLNIELPDVREIFEKIQQVSPLARSVIEGNDSSGELAADGKYYSRWRSIKQWMTLALTDP
jgi:hypothetical protein